jgi:SAM-dependent methyltransferase
MTNSISGWEPTPRWLVTEALKLAEVQPHDLLYDLGCGDGRVVVHAAKWFGARAVGFEINNKLLNVAKERIVRSGLANRARARRQSMLAIPSLHLATVVFLYLPQAAVNRIRPILLGRCSQGARIVSVASVLHNWDPYKELVVRGPRLTWNIGVWYVG